MPVFRYTAIDAGGGKIRRTIEAADLEEARRSLRAAGCTILRIRETGLLSRDISGLFTGRPKAKDMSAFCRQFSSLLRAGATVSAALFFVGRETGNGKLAAAIRDIQTDVEKGRTLAAAVRRYESFFGSMAVSMIAAGEESGKLDDAFAYLCGVYERKDRHRSALEKIMIYPAIMTVVILGVLIVMTTKIVPNFASAFSDMQIELPAITRAVIGVSAFFRDRWPLILCAFILIAGMLLMLSKTRRGKHFFGTLAYRVPVLGPFTVKTSSAVFARTMSQLLGAGIPLPESMQLAAAGFGNLVFSEGVMLAGSLVTGGRSLGESLRAAGIFPAMMCSMVRIGEESGDLTEMLTSIADHYDREADDAAQKLLAVLEPIIIMIMSLFVLIIVLAVFMPTLSLTRAYDRFL